MGLQLEYRDNRGHRHNSLESLVQAEMGKLVDEAARNIEGVIRAQRCPVHGKHPTVSIQKHDEGFSYTIDGCCDELVAKAEEAVEPFLS